MLKIDLTKQFIFEDVIFKNCDVKSVIVSEDDDILESAYSPTRIRELLTSLKISIEETEPKLEFDTKIVPDSEFKKLVNRFLTRFNKTVYQYEKNIKNERHFGNNSDKVLTEVIPLLEKLEIIDSKETRQSKQMNSKAWILRYELEDIFRADDPTNNSILGKFWKTITDHK